MDESQNMMLSEKMPDQKKNACNLTLFIKNSKTCKLVNSDKNRISDCLEMGWVPGNIGGGGGYYPVSLVS